MTTEAAPDPVIANWSDTLESDLLKAGMEQAAAKAYRQAFELGLTRVISTVATRQELKDGLDDLRDDLRREMELRFAGTNQRIEESRLEANQRLAGLDQRIDESRLEMNQRFDESRLEMNRRFEESRSETDQRFAGIDRQISDLEKLMLSKFDDQDKRFRLLVAAMGVGLTALFGLLSAMIVLVA